MAVNTYYQDELRYLREVGPDFARANPEIARLLADRGSDPDVERVLEGVAFLCGRIRQKLDDELPELTASMMSMLWPHYLRPVPSMSIIEFLPDVEAMRAPQTVPAHSEFASIPIDGTQCRYRSCEPTTIRPWSIRDVRLETEAAKPSKLVVSLQAASSAKLEDLQLDRVRFHLAGDAAASFTLYFLLAANVDHVTVSGGAGRVNSTTVNLGRDSVVAAGFDRAEALLPMPNHAFPGYRLLQEYFAFKERFLFVDLLGLDRCVENLGLEQTVELAFVFSNRLETYPLVSRENMRLHCVPIINLFEHTADPIRLRYDRRQYLVQPARSGIADRRHAEVFSVDSVHGVSAEESYRDREYRPFYSFKHTAGATPQEAAYYQSHRVANVLGGDPRLGTDTYVSFSYGRSLEELPDGETVSLELTCTNRNLPDELKANDIREVTDSSPKGIAFRNISKPTPTICPPLGKSLHWRLISHLSLNYVSLTNADRFRELLRVYDFQQEQDVQRSLALQRLLDGIESLRSQYCDHVVRGAPMRGMQVMMKLNEDHFAGEGDAYLFATIVERFLALYVTLNAYSKLHVQMKRSGREFKFPRRWGEQLTPVDTRPPA